MQPLFSAQVTAALLISFALVGCGGGDDNASASAPSASAPVLGNEPGAPAVTGNTATDGFNWFNFRRQQMGVSALARNSWVDVAAQGHSDYQKLNDTVTHVQTIGNPGFTGATLPDRLANASYAFTQSTYAYGEVILASGSTSGFSDAEGLIAAIYHRFVIFEPKYKEAGTGSATSTTGYTYFTTDFTADGLGTGLGTGHFVNYPFDGQTAIPTIFYSDNESPDPVPNQNAVGYPISIHADINALVNVQTFTIQPHGGNPMSVRLLTHLSDADTPSWVAAVVPLSVLAAATTYDVQFTGTVDGVAVNHAWSFTTQ